MFFFYSCAGQIHRKPVFMLLGKKKKVVQLSFMPAAINIQRNTLHKAREETGIKRESQLNVLFYVWAHSPSNIWWNGYEYVSYCGFHIATFQLDAPSRTQDAKHCSALPVNVLSCLNKAVRNVNVKIRLCLNDKTPSRQHLGKVSNGMYSVWKG